MWLKSLPSWLLGKLCWVKLKRPSVYNICPICIWQDRWPVQWIWPLYRKWILEGGRCNISRGCKRLWCLSSDPCSSISSEEGVDVLEVSGDVPSAAVLPADQVLLVQWRLVQNTIYLYIGWKTLHMYVTCTFQTHLISTYQIKSISNTESNHYPNQS